MTNRTTCSMIVLMLALGACGGTEEAAPPGTDPTGTTAPVVPAGPTAPATGQVCAAESHTCVLQPAGTVVCTGRNRDGQLGDGTAQDRLTFVPVVGLTHAIDIDCAYNHTCAARADGHVVCWGRGDEGQLGAQTTPVQAPVEIAGITDAVEVSTGHSFSCARRRTGAVVCWGEGSDGQLGNTARADSRTPVEVSGLADAAEIDSGYVHTCVRRTTGAVACWGGNSSGALGTGDTTAANHPVDVAGITGATLVGTGGYHSCAVSPAGVQCWGNNYNAQVGNGHEEEQSVTHPATLEGLSGVTALALGAQRTCVATATEVRCWGYNNFTAGLLGIENDQLRNMLTPTVVPGITDAATLGSGYDFTCAIRVGGALSCWGSGDDGQMGEGERRGHAARDVSANILTLAPPASVPATFAPTAGAELHVSPHLALGSSHACTVLADGHVRCFGENGDGQLGNGSTLSVSSSNAQPVPGITDAAHVYAYNQTTCVVRANGQVACWGHLAGNGTTTLPQSSSLPVSIAFTDATDLAIASGTLCIVTREGGVSCLGAGGSGQLGNGAREDSADPVAVPGLTDVSHLAATSSTFCALRNAGTVACWGYDGYGECGNGADPCGPAPVEVAGLSRVSQIDGWGYNFCVVANSVVSCWGANDYGQLGNGHAERSEHGEAPAAIRSIRNATEVGVGSGSQCATTSAGEAYCWGSNSSGASGADDSAEDGHNPETSPVQVHRTADPAVAAFTPYLSTDCGSSFCCGIHRDGNVSCWGSTPLGGSGGFLGFSAVRSQHPIVAPGVTIPIAAATPE